MRVCRYAEVLEELQAKDDIQQAAPRPKWPFPPIEISPPRFSPHPLDLVRDVAEPWALDLACKLTGYSPSLEPLARKIFDAAAHGTTDSEATLQLAQSMPSEHVGLRVQAFVAISQTLPCFLGNAWLALIENPAQQLQPQQVPHAVEELLRYAGPSRAIFRGSKALLLAEANRDPARFPDPDRLDFNRDAAGHLAFGAGPHACIGAHFIRAAAICATTALLEQRPHLELAAPVKLRGAFAIRGLASLRVC